MADTRAPFIFGTRRRTQFVASRPFAAGATMETVVLPRVGYLANVVVLFEGTATLSGAGALADLGPWNIVQRARLATNLASASLIDVSGFGAYVMQRSIRAGFSPNLGGMGSDAPNANVYAAPVAAGANTVRFGFKLPVSINMGEQAHLGVINLQAPETSVTLDMLFGAVTEYAALCTALAGTFYIYYEYFDVPDPREFTQPALVLSRIAEDLTPVPGVGDVTYTVPRMGQLIDAAQVVILNGVRSDSIDAQRIVFNKTDTPVVRDARLARFMEREVFGLNHEAGIYRWPFFDADERVNGGAGANIMRDAIDTEELTTLELVTTINAGAALGANNNSIRTIRRFVQMVQLG